MQPKQISAYTILVILVGASSAITALFNPLHAAAVVRVVAAVLSGLSVITVIGHSYLATWEIDVPPDIYSALLGLNGLLVTLLGAAGIITQWFQANLPVAQPWLAFAFQLATLLTSLFAQAFKVQAQKLARKAKNLERARV